ncbi:plantaricin biosynthesis protein (pseudogene) [Lactiplantibacillus plantarum WCFS1]|nr:plantaricin biosynthesis protein (pseudogene) [Lactiplantibacillus plantarum WCFS1]
MSEFNVYYRHS